MPKYLYESHMGGYYTTDEELEDTYCEECGDSDTCLGIINNAEEMIDAIMEHDEEVVPSAYTLQQTLEQFPDQAQSIMREAEAAYFVYQSSMDDVKDLIDILIEKYHVKEDTKPE